MARANSRGVLEPNHGADSRSRPRLGRCRTTSPLTRLLVPPTSLVRPGVSRARDPRGQLAPQVANKTNDIAGDGTTTATVLTRAIFSEGCKAVAAGMNPMDLRRGITLATDAVVEKLGELSRPIGTKEEIAQVATISANSEHEIGQLISDAMERVGKEGVITVNDGKTLENELEVVEGMKFDRGYISPYFITDNKSQTCELENPFVLLVEKKISTIQARSEASDEQRSRIRSAVAAPSRSTVMPHRRAVWTVGRASCAPSRCPDCNAAAQRRFGTLLSSADDSLCATVRPMSVPRAPLSQSIVPLLESVVRAQRPLLMIAEDVESEALATLIVNKLRAGIKICAVKAPGFGDNRKATIQDLAVLTGAQVVSEDVGLKLENVTEEMLGTAKRITISKVTYSK